MSKSHEGKTTSIKTSVLWGCAVFILILSLALSALGAIRYTTGMMDQYRSYIQSILSYTLTEVDADALAKDIESGTPSAAYERTQDVLDRLKESHEIDFIYIVKPISTEQTDNMMNVMAGATAYEKEYEGASLAVLGELTGDAYSPEVAAYYMDAMSSEPGSISYFVNKTEYGHDYTGMTPLFDSQGNPVAILAVDIPIDTIGQALLWYVITSLTSSLLLVVLFTMGMVKWFDRRIVTPITQIQHSAETFVAHSHGQSDPELIEYDAPALEQHDEIWALSESLSTMADDLKSYMRDLIKETQEKERIGAELSVATDIQADMLPSIFPAFPEHGEIDLFATMDPAKEVGGDFYDLFMIDDDHVALVIADVSGKGVPAALFMVIAKTLIKNRAQTGGSPAEILNDVNVRLCEGNGANMFVTVWLAIVNLQTGEGMAANAGHEHPALRRAGGDWELVKYRHSPAVAMKAGVKFREHEFQLYPGDTVFVYTDGAPEAMNEEEELFGEERLLEALREGHPDDLKLLLSDVRESIAEFAGEAEQFDDITMLGIHYIGPNSEA